MSAEDEAALARAARSRGDLAGAETHLRRLLGFRPGDPSALNNLGNVLQIGGRLAEARAAYLDALQALPEHPEILNNLGNAWQAEGNIAEAVPLYRRAIAANPNKPAAHHNLATALKRENHLSEAVAAYRQALALKTDYPEALAGLGSALQAQGDLDAAIGLYEQALALDPNFAEALNHLMFALNARPGVGPELMLQVARHYTSRWNIPPDAVPFGNARAENRPLRVGYVSPDFRAHPVGYFIEGVLAHHHPARIEAVCYSNSKIADAVTARIRAASPLWRDIAGMGDEAAGALIRADGIDILVDLSGHMAEHRLRLFARRAAPVQASWLGFFCSTGLAGMDYFIGDAVTIPPGEEGFYSEKISRLPGCYLCLDSLGAALPQPEPRSTVDGIIFGSLNRRDKINAPLVALWAEILKQVPDSKLLLKTSSLSDATTRDTLAGLFAAQGIGAERLLLEGHTARAEHLAAYGRIDIVLDTFPYGGATTTAEALGMGVPVVSLRGDSFVSRVGASMLEAAGQKGLIAGSGETYVAMAVALAGDATRRAQIGAELRARQVAAAGHIEKFTRELEEVFRAQWRERCAGK